MASSSFFSSFSPPTPQLCEIQRLQDVIAKQAKELDLLKQQVRGVIPFANAYRELEKKFADSQSFNQDLQIRLATVLEVIDGGSQMHSMQCESCEAFYDQATRPCGYCEVAESVCQICCAYPNLHI